MKKKSIGVLILAVCGAAVSQGAVLQISGADTGGSIVYNGQTWNRVDNNPVTGPFVLLDSTGASSGVTYTFSTTGNNFASNNSGQGDPGSAGSNANFSWTTGANSGVTLLSTGEFMPWQVIDSSIANNTVNAVYTITLTSLTQYYFDFTLAASRTGIAGGATSYNVGGTYNTTTKQFDGGTTLTLTAGADQAAGVEFDMGVLTTGANGFLSTWNGSAYEITLQIGKFGTPGGSDAAYLNGLIINTTAIPEPSTMFLLLGGMGCLILLRRFRRS